MLDEFSFVESSLHKDFAMKLTLLGASEGF